MYVCMCVLVTQLCLTVTQWTVALHALLSMVFSRQEHWSGLPFLSPGDLPNPEIEPGSLTWQEDALLSEPPINHICLDLFLVYFAPLIFVCVSYHTVLINIVL